MKMTGANQSLYVTVFAIAFFHCLLCCSVAGAGAGAGAGAMKAGVQREGGVARVWCVASPLLKENVLKTVIDYYCWMPIIDCGVIKPGGMCFEPNTTFDHASVVLNLYFKATGSTKENCGINNWGMLALQNPSSGSCVYA